jgi:hypothetical protein
MKKGSHRKGQSGCESGRLITTYLTLNSFRQIDLCREKGSQTPRVSPPLAQLFKLDLHGGKAKAKKARRKSLQPKCVVYTLQRRDHWVSNFTPSSPAPPVLTLLDALSRSISNLPLPCVSSPLDSFSVTFFISFLERLLTDLRQPPRIIYLCFT